VLTFPGPLWPLFESLLLVVADLGRSCPESSPDSRAFLSYVAFFHVTPRHSRHHCPVVALPVFPRHTVLLPLSPLLNFPGETRARFPVGFHSGLYLPSVSVVSLILRVCSIKCVTILLTITFFNTLYLHWFFLCFRAYAARVLECTCRSQLCDRTWNIILYNLRPDHRIDGRHSILSLKSRKDVLLLFQVIRIYIYIYIYLWDEHR